MILQNKFFASKALVIIQDYLESNMLFHKCIMYRYRVAFG